MTVGEQAADDGASIAESRRGIEKHARTKDLRHRIERVRDWQFGFDVAHWTFRSGGARASLFHRSECLQWNDIDK